MVVDAGSAKAAADLACNKAGNYVFQEHYAAYSAYSAVQVSESLIPIPGGDTYQPEKAPESP